MFTVSAMIVYNICDGKDTLPEITDDRKLNTIGRILVSTPILDAVLCVSALAVGIIGAIGLIPGLSPAASYALIGVGGLIALIWIVLIKGSQGQALSDVKSAFTLALAKNPGIGPLYVSRHC